VEFVNSELIFEKVSKVFVRFSKCFENRSKGGGGKGNPPPFDVDTYAVIDKVR
tara:strand:+ start:105 stop:263 length:159 start_codon:yes stop_codon:yes gene_type:complete